MTRLNTSDVKNILRRRLAAKLIAEADKGSKRPLEELALLGAALSQVGAEFTAQAKTIAMERYRGKRGKQIAGQRLIVEWRPAGEQTRVDSAAVRKAYPPEDRPELWKKASARESVIFQIAGQNAE